MGLLFSKITLTASENYSALSILFCAISFVTSAGYIDIFSCKYYRPEDACTFCKDFFEAKDAKYDYLLRI